MNVPLIFPCKLLRLIIWALTNKYDYRHSSVKKRFECIVLQLSFYITFLAQCACVSAHCSYSACVCSLQGHSRAGEVQDHYHSLLQRSHGEHRMPAEQADWIIMADITVALCPLCTFNWLLKSSLSGHRSGVRHHRREVLPKHPELDEKHHRSEDLSKQLVKVIRK